jgi:hypothetical protein
MALSTLRESLFFIGFVLCEGVLHEVEKANKTKKKNAYRILIKLSVILMKFQQFFCLVF